MPLNHSWSKSCVLTASISFTAIAFTPSAKAQEQLPVNTHITQENHCAVVVNAPNGLSVHAHPSTNSTVLGTLRNRQPVTLRANTLGSWTAIHRPIQGYVLGEYLTRCGIVEESDLVIPPDNQ